jgi:DNA-binding PadR family transcriptional regulator
MKRKKEPNIRERVFRAFLDLIILRAIEEQPMTGYNLLRLFHKKFGILPNSSMIYSCLETMEKKNWIKHVPVKNGKSYSLSTQGQRMVNSMNMLAHEIHDAVKTMMEN